MSLASRHINTVDGVKKYYVSVTSLIVKNIWMLPKFFYHTSQAFKSAKSAPGNISAKTMSYNELQMTISVWESRDDMRKYFRGSAHANAMKQLKSVSSYAKFYGFYTDEIPIDDDIAIAKWKENGRIVHGTPNPKYGDSCMNE